MKKKLLVDAMVGWRLRHEKRVSSIYSAASCTNLVQLFISSVSNCLLDLPSSVGSSEMKDKENYKGLRTCFFFRIIKTNAYVIYI